MVRRRDREVVPGVSHRTKSAEVLLAATKRKALLSPSLLITPARYLKEAVPEALVEEAT
jgi:hypothetical protein